MKIHPSDAALEELLLSLGPAHEPAVRHLAVCAYCRSRLHYLPRRPPSAGGLLAQVSRWLETPDDYRRALDVAEASLRDRAIALGRERDEAPELLLDLLDLPAAQREQALRETPRFHTWGLLELLLERSWETCIRDPAGAEHLAHLGLRLSDLVDASIYKVELIEDLRARSWAYIGNTRRLRSDLDGAAEAFETAGAHLTAGTGDPLERGIFLDLKASLLRARRDFEEAEKLLKRSVAIFLEQGDRHRAGKSLVNLSTVHNYAGNPEEGVAVLYQSIELIDPEQEPRLRLCAWHNLIFILADLGRFEEARSLYREARPFYRDFVDPWTQNRRHWVKGKILRGLGQPARAETLFLATRDGFLKEEIPYDTALVSLELALLYAEQGRAAELKRLAEEMVPVFASRHIHREALAALAFFKQAVEAEQASVEVVRRVADFLKRAEHEPGLRFEGAG